METEAKQRNGKSGMHKPIAGAPASQHLVQPEEKKSYWSDSIGSIPNTGDSVKEVREIRKKLSKEPFDLDRINAL